MGKKAKRHAAKKNGKLAADQQLMKISQWALAASKVKQRNPLVAINPFAVASNLHPPSVNAKIAMDQDVAEINGWAAAATSSVFQEGQAFLGYPLLAEMAQRPEYRRPVEIIARHMTRKWIKLKAKSDDDDKSEKIDVILAEMKRLCLQQAFQRVVELDGFFGRGHLYIDLGTTDDPDELSVPIGNGSDQASLGKLKNIEIAAVRPVEPVWCYPLNYNSNDPLKPDWYAPEVWSVMGKALHHTRLLTLIGREVPDMLKPAYSFGGLSMTQMGKPYVDNWLKTRQSVADIISSFSVFVLATGLIETVMAAEDQLITRAQLFNNLRDNAGLMMIDKTHEDFKNISAPLGTLDSLQAQTQEHMAACWGIPLVELLGIQPAGLNASSEGEIMTFENTINAAQERMFRKPVEKIINLIQLSKFGAIDQDIIVEFVPLHALSELEISEKQNRDANTDALLSETGAIDSQEIRQRWANDPASPYPGLDVDKLPQPPMANGQDPDAGDLPGLKGPPKPHISRPGSRIGGTTAPSPFDHRPQALAADTEFREADHPRGQPENAGQFTAGGGGGKKTSKAAPASAPAAAGSTFKSYQKGDKLPAHIPKFPPGWTDVKINPDPNGNLLVLGKDAKGRTQAVYSRKFAETNAAAKFARIQKLMESFEGIQKQNAANKPNDHADALDLIMKTGLRPGSEADTGGAVKAYGATTLEGRHVVTDAQGNVSLAFVGKHGVNLKLPVQDPDLAAMLQRRAKQAGPKGQLFPNVRARTLSDYAHTLGDGSFKPKDFRTQVGTSTAYQLVQGMPFPQNAKEYKQAVMEVAKQVSKRLGNTPVVALQSYINPAVFSEWQDVAKAA